MGSVPWCGRWVDIEALMELLDERLEHGDNRLGWCLRRAYCLRYSPGNSHDVDMSKTAD